MLPLAEHDLELAFLRVREHAPQTAAKWLTRFTAALQSLATHPQRCGLAPEHRKLKRELRQLLFGKKPHVFRVIFVIGRDTVLIIRIRHAARRPARRKDLGDTS